MRDSCGISLGCRSWAGSGGHNRPGVVGGGYGWLDSGIFLVVSKNSMCRVDGSTIGDCSSIGWVLATLIPGYRFGHVGRGKSVGEGGGFVVGGIWCVYEKSIISVSFCRNWIVLWAVDCWGTGRADVGGGMSVESVVRVSFATI